MAAATFNDVLNAQRETNQILGKQKNPLDGRTGAGKALLDAQKETTSALFSVVDSVDAVSEGVANPPKPDKSSASAAKETKKDNQSFLSKTFGKFGSKIEDGFKSLKGVLGKFKDSAMSGLKAFLLAAGLFALIKFLESKTWKKIRDFIKDNPLKGVMLALTGLFAVLFPITTIRLITKLMGGIVKSFKAAPAILNTVNKMASADLFAPFKRNGSIGRAFRTMRVFFKRTLPNKIKGVIDLVKNISPKKELGKVFKGIGKGFKVLGGIFRTVFLPLGLIIGLVTGIYDGLMAGYKKFQETGSIVDALIAGVTTFIGTFVGAIPDMIKSALSWILEKIGSIFGIESFKNASAFLDSFSISDLITDGLGKVLTMITDFFKSLPEMLESALRSFGMPGDFIADKFFGEKTEDELNVEKEKEEKETEEKEKRIKKDERVRELIKEKNLTSGEAHQIARAEQAAEAQGAKRPMDDAAALEKSLAVMKKQMEDSAPSVKRFGRSAKQTKEEESVATMQDRRQIADQIALLEHRKAELETSRASGNVTNIAQNNSSNVSAPTTRQESIVVTDSDMMGVVAAGPA